MRAFVQEEAARLKGVTPDVGALLALYTTCSEVAPLPAFLDSYIDESFVRSVMHWKRNDVPPAPEPVFAATEISRNILRFQVLVITTVVTEDPAAAAADLDATNGRCPERLEALLAAWKAPPPASWAQFFEALGLRGKSARAHAIVKDTARWIAECARRASERGPAYGGPSTSKADKGSWREGRGGGGRGSQGRGGGGGGRRGWRGGRRGRR